MSRRCRYRKSAYCRLPFHRDPTRIDLYASHKTKGYQFPYSEGALAALRRETSQVTKRSLVSIISEESPGSEVRRNIDVFVSRLKETQAAKHGKVKFNVDESGRFAYQVTWLRSDAVAELGENAEGLLEQTVSKMAPLNIHFSEGTAISWSNGKVSLYGIDDQNALVDFRTDIVKGQARPVVHLPVATVEQPLDSEELEEWRNVIREYENTDFGTTPMREPELVEHSNDFLTNATVLASFRYRSTQPSSTFPGGRSSDVSQGKMGPLWFTAVRLIQRLFHFSPEPPNLDVLISRQA